MRLGWRLTGDIRALGALGGALATLDLSNCEHVSGDLNGIASLTWLTHLDLYGTEITGNLASVTSLVELTYLSLANTGRGVTGDLSALAPLTQITKLWAATASPATSAT